MNMKKEKRQELSRRQFIQKTGTGTVGLGLWMAGGPWMQAVAAGDPVRIGMLGFGVRGRQLAMAVERVGGMEIAVVCDVYDGRFRRAQEVLQSRNVETTKDYLQVLNRSDIDAVVIATPDHWHRNMAVEALEAGKDVYLEKPLAHTIEDGKEIVKAVARTGQMLEVGSQLMSSAHLHEAKELIKEGRLGEVTQVKARWDTGNVIGAWVKPVPPDASPDTIDWERFLGPAPRRPFEAERVFRWRCYSDYSEGLPGDVLVHLITEIHWLLDLDVPTQVSAAGGILRWKDDRDVADTVSALCQYPEGVVLNIGATQANGYDGQLVQLLGTKATLELTHRGWKLYEERYPDGYPYVVEAWPREFREEFYREHDLPLGPRREPEAPPPLLASYESPSGYDSTTEHVRNFLASIRSRRQPLEDAAMGNRAAVVAHLINLSLDRKASVTWDRNTQTFG